MIKDNMFKKSYAPQLLRIAKADLEAAELLHQGKTQRKENILYHVEQTIEKCLKAYLCHQGIAVPLTSNLNVIADRSPSAITIPHAEDLEDLGQFATVRRYEEGQALFSEEEIQSALLAAKDIVHWLESVI